MNYYDLRDELIFCYCHVFVIYHKMCKNLYLKFLNKKEEANH